MDISSMIDCCFLLLIYFLVATTLVTEKKLDISIPGDGPPSSEQPPLDPGKINVNADGSVYWNTDVQVGAAFDPGIAAGSPAYSAQRRMETLVNNLKQLKDQATAIDVPPIVLLTGHADAPHQRIVDVMAAMAEAGISSVGLSTTTE